MSVLIYHFERRKLAGPVVIVRPRYLGKDQNNRLVTLVSSSPHRVVTPAYANSDDKSLALRKRAPDAARASRCHVVLCLTNSTRTPRRSTSAERALRWRHTNSKADKVPFEIPRRHCPCRLRQRVHQPLPVNC